MKQVAVIGAGYWGKNLIRNFSSLGALDTVCDIDAGKLRDVRSAFPSVNITSSYLEVLKNRRDTAVVISTPAATHYQLTKECLLAGKDVFVEKPLSLTLEESAELVNLAAKKKRILMVGHLLEYHPGIIKLKNMIDKGELGKINYIYSNRLNLGKIRREENILWSFAPHDISVMLLLLEEMPASVSAHGGYYLHKNIADVTVSNLEFRSGVKGHIFVSWLHPYKEQKLVVVGDKKMALFDDVAKKDKLLLYNHKIKWVGRLPVPVSAAGARAVKFKMTEPLKEECGHFIACVKNRTKPRTDGHNGVRVLEVLRACQDSLEKSGRIISLRPDPFQKRDIYVHPTAVVEEYHNIGRGTQVWHYSHISKGAKVGTDCRIGQNVFIGGRAEIGSGVKIQNNVSIYDCVKLEDGVFCGPSLVFTNVTNPRSHIPRKHEFKETLIKKGATLGANATIVCGHTIGEYAFVGAGAVVTKDVPAHALVYGNPARVKGWMCACGVRLDTAGETGLCKSCGSAVSIPADQRKEKTL